MKKPPGFEVRSKDKFFIGLLWVEVILFYISVGTIFVRTAFNLKDTLRHVETLGVAFFLLFLRYVFLHLWARQAKGTNDFYFCTSIFALSIDLWLLGPYLFAPFTNSLIIMKGKIYAGTGTYLLAWGIPFFIAKDLTKLVGLFWLTRRGHSGFHVPHTWAMFPYLLGAYALLAVPGGLLLVFIYYAPLYGLMQGFGL